MVDSTVGSGDVVDECPAGAPELVVQGDARCERQGPCEQPFPESGQCPGTVTFQRQDVFHRPEDALDSLADRSEMGPAGLVFVFASWSHDVGAEIVGGSLKVSAGVSLITDHCECAAVTATREQPERDVTFAVFGAGDLQRDRGAVRGEQSVQPEPPEMGAWLAQ